MYGSLGSALIYGIIMIIISLLAAPQLLVSKRPDAKEFLDKLVPFQGWAGVVFCIWGIWQLIQVLQWTLLLQGGIWGILLWLTFFLYAAVAIILGFILGYSLFVKYVLGKNEAAKEKADKMMKKLQSIQTKVAIVGIIVGIWYIVGPYILNAIFL